MSALAKHLRIDTHEIPQNQGFKNTDTRSFQRTPGAETVYADTQAFSVRTKVESPAQIYEAAVVSKF